MQIIDDQNKFENCRFNKSKNITTKNCVGCGNKPKITKEKVCKKLNIVTSRIICAMCPEFQIK